MASVRPRVTRALLGTIVVAFAAQTALGSAADPLGVIALGGNAPDLVAAGQLERLVTANFLHGGLLHIGMNGLALWLLGGLMERLLGGARFFVVYAVAAVGGSVTSCLAAPGLVSVGASTALYGLFGALAVVQALHYRSMPPGVRQTRRWWITIVAINLGLLLVVPNIDLWGHAGGLVAGCATTAVLVWRRPPLAGAARRATTILAGLLAASFAMAGGVTVGRAVWSPEADVNRVAWLISDRQDVDPAQLNNMAWAFATDPDARDERLAIALRLAERACMQAPAEPAFQDTLATVHYRLGDFDRAVAVERAIVESAHADPIYLSQLARFLHARVRRDGPVHLPDGREPGLTLRYADGGVTARSAGTAPTGLVLYALALRDDALVGLLVARIGPGLRPPPRTALRADWARAVTITVALSDTRAGDEPGWHLSGQAIDAEIAALP